MIALVQKVSLASVNTNSDKLRKISNGLIIYLGIGYDDDKKDVEYLTNKILNLRIFDDEKGIMNLSVLDIKGDILVISQFTLKADTKKGNRPSYKNAANKDYANPLYELFIKKLKTSELNVESGYFGKEMFIKQHNIGPVSIIINSKE